MIFNWILFNKFAVGTPIILKNEQLLIKEKGIKTVLDLRNSDDFNLINHQKYIKNLSGLVYKNFPLPDHKSGRLAETFEIRQAVDMLHSSLSQGPVFIHCHASIERSPLISIAYLHLKKGFSIIQCCDFVKQQHKPTVVNVDQLKYVK